MQEDKALPIFLNKGFSVIFFPVSERFLGRKFSFQFDNFPVTIEIPPKSKNKTFNFLEKRGEVKGEVFYEVTRIEIYVDTQTPTKIPAKALEDNSIRIDHYSETLEKKFKSILEKHQDIPARAFSNFSRVLRWKAKRNILRPSYQTGPSSGGGFELLAGENLIRVYGGSIYLSARMDTPITEKTFKKTQEALSKGLTSPVWFDFLYDAYHRQEMGDKEGALLFFVISLETIMRGLFWLDAPNVTNEGFRNLVDGINIRGIISKRKKFCIWDEDIEKVFDHSLFNKILDWRNSLMHNAIIPELGPKSLQQIRVKLTNFVLEADKKINLSK